MEKSDLKVLMISSDRGILSKGSAVSERMKEYGKLINELHIVLLSDSSHGLLETELDANIWVYPTNSRVNFLRPIDAKKLGKKIILDKKFVRGKSLITADSIDTGWAGLHIKKYWRLPLEVQLHTDPFSPYFSGFQNNVRKFFAKKVIENADSIRVVSESVAGEIRNRLPSKKNKINVLPIYVDRKRIESRPMTFDLRARYGWNFIILCVSRLTKEKNLSLALEVLSRLKVHYPDIGLVIVGSGPEEGKLKMLAKTKGIKENIAFVGWQEDIASYYKSANIFLQTSFFEGYGLALVEAGISGLPVVSTNVGIANELENGKDLYVCPIDNADYMFKAVYDLVENKIKRDSLKINMMHALDEKLISKEEYLNKLKKSWKDTSMIFSK